MVLLGIDVGTGGTRAILIDAQGRLLGSATAEHAAFASPRPGWAEQDPHDWWRATQEAVRAALSRASTSTLADGRPVTAEMITGIGLSGQMHGSVMLDARDEVVRPALLWCDQRTAEECREITERVGAERLIEWVSNPALTGFTLPKLLWMRTHEPERWARVRSVLLPKDYVRFRLTGERATDVADASGTLLFDVTHRRWSSEMLDAMGLDASLLPRVFESPEITGTLTEEGARATGLRPGIPVVAGGGDQAAGAVGMGIVQPGLVSATIGTSGVVFASTDRPAFDPQGRVHTFCHAVPGRWHVMGVTLAAGLSLRWFRDRFGVATPIARAGAAPAGALPASTMQASTVEASSDRDPYDLLSAEAADVPPGAEGLLWTPYLMGERTPHLDPHARAALVGLSASHTRGHIIRAILEGVAFSLEDTFQIFAEMQVPVTQVRLGGGGARSPLWRQIQADIYGHDVACVQAEEGAAYGAALLAGVGAGVWPTVDAACDAVVRVAHRTPVQPETRAAMQARYRVYRRIYPALRDIETSA
jgi:xylulokinase